MTHYPAIERRDGTLFFAVNETDRLVIAMSIERLIDVLDALDGDENLEPDLAGWDHRDDREGADDSDMPGIGEGDNADYEPMLGAPESIPQHHWYKTSEYDECEVENEHGGNILDDPHDDEGEAEPFLGWSSPESRDNRRPDDWSEIDDSGDSWRSSFDGSGKDIAVKQLRDIHRQMAAGPDIVGEPGSMFLRVVRAS
ncbi:MAG: hypothetical protein JWM58_2541 [Rhizobium sp.]|nr:hypothetical protein [Rhizobium sp.]